jgi:hypothetical protein
MMALVEAHCEVGRRMEVQPYHVIVSNGRPRISDVKSSGLLPELIITGNRARNIGWDHMNLCNTVRVTTFRRRFCGTPSVTNPPVR